MYALCVVYNPSNPHLALGPVCTLVADSACCAPIYMHEHWTVLNTDRISNIVTLLFQACAGSCNAYYWRIKTILHWVARQTTHDGWLGGPYYLWVVRGCCGQKWRWNPYTCITSVLFIVNHHQGIYPKILLSLEGTRCLFKVLQSFWNFTGSSAPVLPSHLSTFKVIGVFFQTTHSCQTEKNLSEIH